jgi:hypothetical protein
MIHTKAKLLVSLAIVAQALSACSGSQFLKSMDLSVTQQNSDSFINLSTEVAMGNISLAQATITIKDPNDPTKELGSIGMDTAADGNQTFTLSLDATTITKGDATLGSTLPNGRALPSAVGGTMLGLSVLNDSRVYVGGDLKSTILVGFALTISAFDSLSVIGNSNIFFAETFNTSLSGVAGIFSGTTAGTSGLAVFAKYTAPAAAAPAPTTLTANARELSLSTAPVATISVSGKVSGKKANTVINEGASQGGEETVYNYFYGKKRVVSPQ